MLLTRALCGVLGSLVVLPLEMAQLAWETDRMPRVHPISELTLACAGGALAFATQSTAREQLPPPWSTVTTVFALTPIAVTGQYLRLRARLGAKKLRPLFVLCVTIRELVLYSVLFSLPARPYAPLIAHVTSYPLRLLSIACYVPVTLRTRGMLSEIFRASLALWCSTCLAQHLTR